jgi:hypothetical protein
MYSASSFGTHHIFFPPRLQVVSRQELPYGFALDLSDDSALLGLLGNEAHGPTSAAVGRSAAHHGDDRTLVGVVQERRWTRTRFVGQGRFDPAVQKPPANPSHLAPIRPYGRRCSGQGPALVEQLENANATPVTFAKSAEAFDVLELLAVSLLEPQPRKTLALLLHPKG